MKLSEFCKSANDRLKDGNEFAPSFIKRIEHLESQLEKVKDEKDQKFINYHNAANEKISTIKSQLQQERNQHEKIVENLQNEIDDFQPQLKGFKFCPQCGDKLEHQISTDASTDKVCKSELCKKTKT